MEENKRMVSKKFIIILISVIVILIIVALLIVFFVLFNNSQKNSQDNKQNSQLVSVVSKKNSYENEINKVSVNKNSYKEIHIEGNTYYQRISSDIWNGNYHQENFYTFKKMDSIIKVVSYSKYLEILGSVNFISDEKKDIYYNDKDSNYIILCFANGHSWCKMDLMDIIEDEDNIIIYGDESINGVMASGSGYFIAIPTNKPVGTEIEYRECYDDSEIDNLKKYGSTYDPHNIIADKPIIYLYPTQETEISVKLLKPENLTCSYPQYKDGWNVIARPDGSLRYIKNGRQLYSLYYECKSSVEFNTEKDGFVVKGEDSAEFLEDKLSVLGLTEREAEEFIVYWLPKLQSNKYNYIKFSDMNEINENMPFKISPEPDSVIRIFMTFKGLDSPVSVNEQKLTSPERTGFTVVEWGGTEIK